MLTCSLAMPLDCQAADEGGESRYGLNDPATMAKMSNDLDIGCNESKAAVLL